MQGCVLQVRLLQSMHAQDQQKQVLQVLRWINNYRVLLLVYLDYNHSLEENGQRPLISSIIIFYIGTENNQTLQFSNNLGLI